MSDFYIIVYVFLNKNKNRKWSSWFGEFESIWVHYSKLYMPM